MKGMTTLPTALTTEGRRQLKGSRTMPVGHHRARITDDMRGLHRRTKGGRTITRHRRSETSAIETKVAIVIVIAILTVAGMANPITGMCTLRPELLLHCRRVNRFW